MLESVGSVSRAQSSPPPQIGGGKDYKVQRGDTLGEIATRFGTDVKTLQALNDISNPNRIMAGQTITVPSSGKAVTVQRGDTLTEIARENNTSVAALMKANPEIRNANQIYPGDVVRVPAGGPQAAPRVQAPQAPKAPVAKPVSVPIGPNTPATVGVITPGEASLKAADVAGRAADGRSSKGECYAWVKRALLKSGAVPVYLEGVPAKSAGPQLVKYGFVNILGKPGYNIQSAYDAPKGAVLVYGAASGASDKNAKYGHIEIRTDKGFASDYHSANARTGPESNGLSSAPGKVNGRILIGVYIKPDAGANLTQAPIAERPQPATTQLPAVKGDIYERLGKLISHGEGNYESYNAGTLNNRVKVSRLDPPAGTVTNKTINEILATQNLHPTNPNRLFATGKYQTIIPTLREAKQAMGLTGNERYTPELQERVFREFLINKAGGGKLSAFINDGKGSVDGAQYAAAKEWASIAVPAGLPIRGYTDKAGKYHPGPISNGRMSYYESKANHANMESTNQLRAALEQIDASRSKAR